LMFFVAAFFAKRAISSPALRVTNKFIQNRKET
jgi:hypothetical protein